MKQSVAFAGLLLSLAAVAPTARAGLITYNNNSFVLVLSTGPSGNITSWNLAGSGNSTQTSSYAMSTRTLVGGIFGEPVGVAGGFDYSTTEPEDCVNNLQCYGSLASTNQAGNQPGSWTVTVANNSYTYTYTGPNYSVFETAQGPTHSSYGTLLATRGHFREAQTQLRIDRSGSRSSREVYAL